MIITFTKETQPIQYLLSNAGEAIYWGTVIENKYDYDTDKRLVVESLAHNSCTVKKCHNVTDPMIKKGIKLFIESHPHRANEIFGNDMDIDTCNHILQYSIYGKLIYG